MANESVLVVDDFWPLSALLEAELEDLGYRVHTADDIERGFETAVAERVDAVVLDISLPGGSGLDLLPWLKMLPWHPAAMIVTGRGSESVAQEAVRKGADEYLAKPLSPDLVTDRLRHMLDRRAGLHAGRPGLLSARSVPGELRARVLVVDDDAKWSELVSLELADRGHSSVRAPNIAEARAIGDREAFDAVLLDLDLPDGWGLDAVSHFKGVPSRPAVLIVTGHGSEDLVGESLRQGADDYVVKSIAAADLVERLHIALARRDLAPGIKSANGKNGSGGSENDRA